MKISKKDMHWLKLAANAAMSSQCKFKHGVIIVSGGRPISIGVNLTKFRNCRTLLKDASSNEEAEKRRSRQETTHAEAHALLKIRCNFNGATLYSARYRKNGEYGLSKPCAACAQLIELSGVKKVVYFDRQGIVKSRTEDL